jgi:hypothetical protein
MRHVCGEGSNSECVLLHSPTVANMIHFLQTLPPDAPLRINDPDTCWEVSIIHLYQDENGWVWLTGAYGEMGRR